MSQLRNPALDRRERNEAHRTEVEAEQRIWAAANALPWELRAQRAIDDASPL